VSVAAKKSAKSGKLETFVALLRGINVGGKNLVPMKDLCALFEGAGCADVRHYIQSGNVVYRADAGAGDAGEKVARAIAKRFGLEVPVVVRTAAEMKEVARSNPLLAEGAPIDSLHVLFLAHAPDAKQRAALDPDRSPPDRFLVAGREVFLSCPNGVGRTKLTNAYFDSKLKTVSTGRNWRTVLKLVEMSSED
jgi:uncharacterized protein (DUF1697 family)